ncbi:MAG: diaminopropionate ammonia-lyase [Deltaproteobacteria bacterium]|nr:diaminopropionate ammonia-lyase [Deltaproteobacteria bacterium]MDE0035879.1 diaminopropionate ammonia-lyase [Deltaproteobacteria bacterium]
MNWTLNPDAAPPMPYPAALQRIIGGDAHREARAEISAWPGYAPTPLRNARALASSLGVESVWVKDESGRFGLGSFKALGGAYGIRRVMEARARRAASSAGNRGEGRPATQTVTCASDGNHGRAVAWGARMFGCDAVVYLPVHVTEVRAGAIRSFGARVVRVDGEYDDAVAQAARDAARNGWTVISDTSYPGYMEIPRHVMVGYTIMANEALDALLPMADMHRNMFGHPTHVFIQGGVGGLAAAAIGHAWERLGADRPVAVIVEPDAADGLLQSALAGKPSASRGDLHTIMAGLSCREISPLAWEIVGKGAHAFMTVPEDGIAPLMRAAARGELGEPFEGGESGVAGLLGLIEVARDEERRRAIGLDEGSRVLVFNTEGATDPELYARIVD